MNLITAAAVYTGDDTTVSGLRTMRLAIAGTGKKPTPIPLFVLPGFDPPLFALLTMEFNGFSYGFALFSYGFQWSYIRFPSFPVSLTIPSSSKSSHWSITVFSLLGRTIPDGLD